MAYFYDNNVRKIPGPSYVFDYIYTDPNTHPGTLSSSTIESSEPLNAVEIGRYILYSPNDPSDEMAPFAGTAWQKVVKDNKVQFVLVADKYTNPVEGLTAEEMERIWNQVWEVN